MQCLRNNYHSTQNQIPRLIAVFGFELVICNPYKALKPKYSIAPIEIANRSESHGSNEDCKEVIGSEVAKNT